MRPARCFTAGGVGHVLRASGLQSIGSPERRMQAALWRTLGDTLLRQGKVKVANACYQQSRKAKQT